MAEACRCVIEIGFTTYKVNYNTFAPCMTSQLRSLKRECGVAAQRASCSDKRQDKSRVNV